MASQFTLSYKGVGEMLRSEEMVAAMGALGEKVKERAETIAPVAKSGPHPGRYKESFEVETTNRGGYEHDRARARIRNFAPEGLWVEVGSKHNRAHHVLKRALDALSAD